MWAKRKAFLRWEASLRCVVTWLDKETVSKLQTCWTVLEYLLSSTRDSAKVNKRLTAARTTYVQIEEVKADFKNEKILTMEEFAKGQSLSSVFGKFKVDSESFVDASNPTAIPQMPKLESLVSDTAKASAISTFSFTTTRKAPIKKEQKPRQIITRQGLGKQMVRFDDNFIDLTLIPDDNITLKYTI